VRRSSASRSRPSSSGYRERPSHLAKNASRKSGATTATAKAKEQPAAVPASPVDAEVVVAVAAEEADNALRSAVTPTHPRQPPTQMIRSDRTPHLELDPLDPRAGRVIANPKQIANALRVNAPARPNPLQIRLRARPTPRKSPRHRGQAEKAPPRRAGGAEGAADAGPARARARGPAPRAPMKTSTRTSTMTRR